MRATVPFPLQRVGADVVPMLTASLACAIVATVALGFAVEVNFGQFAPQAIGALAAALIAGLGTLLARGTIAARVANVLLGIALALQFTPLLTHVPCATWPAGAGRELLIFRGGVALACLVAALATFAPPAIRRVAGPLLIGIHLLLGLLVLRTVPQPGVDVCTFQRESSEALLHGHNPYTINFADPYGPASGFYGVTLVKDGRTTFGYPYPPLPLLLAIPGRLLGDFRLSLLLATTLAGALLMRARPGSPLGAAAAALLFFTPRGFFVLEAGWIEPFVVLLMAGVIFLACRVRIVEGREATSRRRRPPVLPLPDCGERAGERGSGSDRPVARQPLSPALSPEYWGEGVRLAIVAGLFLASKQYLVLAAPLLFLLPIFRNWKSWSITAIAGALVTIPMALWNLPAFVNSVVTLQFHQPFRPDSLSFLVPMSKSFGATPPSWIPFVVAASVIVIALRKAPRTPSGFALATAAVFLAFFAFNKQAFCNYYHFVIGALCCALAAAEPVAAGKTFSVVSGIIGRTQR